MWDLLWVLYIPAKHCVSSMSPHSLCVSVTHFRLLKWKKPMFISLSLWLQHPDLNPVNYKIYIEIQQRVCLRKIHNVNGPTLSYGWHCFEQRIIKTGGLNVTECVLCKRTTFVVFNLTADSTFVNVNVLVWCKVSWCYCVEYIRILIFFTFRKVVWLHS